MRKKKVADEDLFNKKDIVRILKKALEEDLKEKIEETLKDKIAVYDLNESWDAEEMPCVSFKADDDSPNQMDVIVHAETEEEADLISKLALDYLEFMKKVGVTVCKVWRFGCNFELDGPEPFNTGVQTVNVRLNIRGK